MLQQPETTSPTAAHGLADRRYEEHNGTAGGFGLALTLWLTRHVMMYIPYRTGGRKDMHPVSASLTLSDEHVLYDLPHTDQYHLPVASVLDKDPV